MAVGASAPVVGDVLREPFGDAAALDCVGEVGVVDVDRDVRGGVGGVGAAGTAARS